MSGENTRATRDEMLQEAAARLKLLKVFEETARQFNEDGQVSLSIPPWGAYFWLDDETQKAVDEFEQKNGGLVYTVIRTPTTDLGVLDSFVYVSPYKEEWPMDRRDIAEGRLFVWVNVSGGAGFSEFGTIGYKLGPAAGLLRTY